MTVALFVGSASAADADEAPGLLPKCITMTTEARPSGGGCDHIVHFGNQCGAAATCTVSTDVQPEPVWADLPNQKDTDVVTSKGSSEAAFRPYAFCLVDDH